ncbi:MAG TPA: hypothetical protein VEK08_14780 [Planctomycetota bacterium]|nr:hypothetical protein [Planctomycetota bacterium]
MNTRVLIAVLLLCSLVRAEEDSKAQVDVAIRDDSFAIPAGFTVRARVKAITPKEPTGIAWRWGGEGLGGKPVTGHFAEDLEFEEWSPPLEVSSFVKGKFPARLYLTVTCGKSGKRNKNGEIEGQSRDVEVEFEFSYKNKVVKTFSEKGSAGTVGIIIPASFLSGGRTPESPEFLEHLSGLLAYAERRAKDVAAAGGSAAVLKKYNVITDLGGYGNGIGYGIRYTNKAIVDAETRTLQALGINGLANCPEYIRSAIAAGDTASPFAHVAYLQLGGYPVPAVRVKEKPVPEAGCPWAPGVEVRTKEMIENGVATALKAGTREVWWRTEDEIGAVFDGAPEGKAHLVTCPHCVSAFREYLKQQRRTPAEFGAADWNGVKPVNIFEKNAPELKPGPESLAAYYTAHFLNYSSAKLFTPLRQRLAQLNEEKVKSGKTSQPFIYSFALRGNTFLMGGHSLDFFDFYRHADNAFVYETSNRDIRITGWDSYLCDVGRTVSENQKLKFGIYVKPHRGAPIQRTLSAVARGAQMLYWYTYGPDYVKGDSFSESLPNVLDVSRAASLLRKSEEALFGSTWLRAPEVAVVNPRSSEFWSKATRATAAAYENAKWIYSALQHAHIPVDPIDEVMLETEDLSRYKVIYISGENLTRAAAEKVAAWVKAGGTLYTSGGGLQRDEANQPLDLLQPMLGLAARAPVEHWYSVSAYGATKLETWDDPKKILAPVPAGAEIVGEGDFARFMPVVGREPLKAAAGAQVLAKFADGSAALTCNSAGKGKVFVAGFYPGLEYSAKVRREDFDMSADFEAGRRRYVSVAALEKVQPVVDAAEPLVEGVLLKTPAGKRALVLMNWAYKTGAKRSVNGKISSAKVVIPCNNLKITLRGVAPVAAATSMTSGKPLQVIAGESTVIVLPELQEGDVLLLD